MDNDPRAPGLSPTSARYESLEWPRKRSGSRVCGLRLLVSRLACNDAERRGACLLGADLRRRAVRLHLCALLHIFMCWRLTVRQAPAAAARHDGRRVRADLQRVGRPGAQDAARGARDGLSARDLAARRRPSRRDACAGRAARRALPRPRRQRGRESGQPEPCAEPHSVATSWRCSMPTTHRGATS